MRILIIEDDTKNSEFIKRALVEATFAVDVAVTGVDGLDAARTCIYDLILLGMIKSGKDGFEICRSLRNEKVATPILLLTCNNDVLGRVSGLNFGADDCLEKPFAIEELLARVHALLRREKSVFPTVLSAWAFTMNTITRECNFGHTPLILTAKEYAVMEYLLRHPNIVVTRTMLEQHVWNQEFESGSNLVDVIVKRLRQKIGKDGKSIIQTIRGAGYCLNK